jgi:uracil-DNA glycosylase
VAIVLDSPVTNEGMANLIQAAISDSGLTVTKVLIVPAVSIMIPRKPTQRELSSWVPHLSQQLSYVRGIVALGKVAQDAVSMIAPTHLMGKSFVGMPLPPHRGWVRQDQWVEALAHALQSLA